ncbi:MAG: TIGR03960 family B12-binding radical SAM protein [Candidatus Saganbacteria bacterium]|nr:TIGR03960 family B12-binding radical SAM protein [Candidatus Saganbacteria bacterium]
MDHPQTLADQILPLVQKPARYVGGELNAIKKEWDKAIIKFALAYPDAYEIGMSNLGLQILYHIINDQPDCLAERVFAPWPDMEQQLIGHGSRVTSLESQTPLNKFDVLGFSLGHELTYTNIITMLKLGGIPLHAKDRGDHDPLILGGGPCVFNPEPVAEFFDFFVLGEAEEVLLEIVNVLRSTLNSLRSEKLQALSRIKGIYVPQYHAPVEKRYIKELTTAPYPLHPIVPFIEAVHDRAALEIMRGCKWGCKFCQAGWTYRPVREKEMETLLRQADEVMKNTGYEELTLISLSSSDYSKIDELAKTLAKKYESKKINISLPSLRTNSFSVKLAKEVARVRSSSITLAPEAGTQRLRDIIGKNMSEENIIEGVSAAFDEGIEAVKLYFMIGLPTETDEDLLGICRLAEKIMALGRSRSRRARVTVNLSTFIPKPHTPFQWERQITIAETLARQDLIKRTIRNRNIEIKWHQAEASYLEGIFSRGDKKLTAVLEKAWTLGARFDAWSEHFKFAVWQKAFAGCGVDPDEYLKARPFEAPLPWDYIETGVPKEVLLNQAKL